MTIIVRLGGLSVACDGCGQGGFVGTHDESMALGRFSLQPMGDGDKHICPECAGLEEPDHD